MGGTDKFPDCDVSIRRSEFYDLRTRSLDIVIKVILSPNGKKRPTEKQLRQVESDLLEAACSSMEKQRADKLTSVNDVK
jgi:hypothetical protein